MHIIEFPSHRPPERNGDPGFKRNKASVSVSPYRQSHFAPAFYFLAPTRRKALSLLYAVFRVLDDIVDTDTQHPAKQIEAWRKVFVTGDPSFVALYGHAQLAHDFLVVSKRYEIPTFPLVDFIDKGVRQDLFSHRFETPLDTERYCYGVAGTVGLACLPIFGVPWQEGKDFAIRLGIAVQWINSLRDVGVDAKMGRIYFPLSHLEEFGVSESEILALRPTASFQKLMEHEAAVARNHYRRAMELLPPR